jgi:hypothetical protein
MRLRVLLPLLLSGCVTGTAAAPPAGSVLLEVPDDGCEPLGSMAVRVKTELLMPEDSLLAGAVNELRRRAAARGATHLVVASAPGHGSLSYGSTATAAGFAYRCSGHSLRGW